MKSRSTGSERSGEGVVDLAGQDVDGNGSTILKTLSAPSSFGHPPN